MQAVRPFCRRGFSLVELSIVLVILGLLTGGILAGRSLVHASELRKVGTEITNYRTAAFAFRDKYFYIPGDMPNPDSFWPGTRGGYGNGRVYWNIQGPNFWNHLQNAGMIAGSIAPSSTTITQALIGTHVPACPLGACGYSMTFFSAWSAQPQLAGRNVLVMGKESVTDGYTSGNLTTMPGEDLWNIDTKLDDGRADLGLIVGSGCINGTYPNSVYLINNASAGCTMLMDFFKY